MCDILNNEMITPIAMLAVQFSKVICVCEVSTLRTIMG